MKLVLSNTEASINDKTFKSKDSRTVLKHGERVTLINKKGEKQIFFVRRILNKRLLILEERKGTKMSYSSKDIIQLVIQAFLRKL